MRRACITSIPTGEEIARDELDLVIKEQLLGDITQDPAVVYTLWSRKFPLKITFEDTRTVDESLPVIEIVRYELETCKAAGLDIVEFSRRPSTRKRRLTTDS